MEQPTRKSPRLKAFDYSTPGVYFVTICTYKMRMLFWEKPMRPALENHSENLNFAGKIADEIIRTLPKKFPVVIDKYVIMPNHVHLMIRITEYLNGTGANSTLCRIISYTKREISLALRKNNIDEKIWHRSFYDHVVRNEKDYVRILSYIENNPKKWTEDRFYTECKNLNDSAISYGRGS